MYLSQPSALQKNVTVWAPDSLDVHWIFGHDQMTSASARNDGKAVESLLHIVLRVAQIQ
jgi:hypothetical protein